MILSWRSARVLARDWYREYRAKGWTIRQSAIAAMESMDTVQGTHGVAFLGFSRNCSSIFYLNTGESYETTLLCYISNSRVRFVIGNWGDLVEAGYAVNH